MGGSVSAAGAGYVAAQGGILVTTVAQVAFVAAGAEVSFSNAADESIHHHPPKSSSPTVVRDVSGRSLPPCPELQWPPRGLPLQALVACLLLPLKSKINPSQLLLLNFKSAYAF